MCSTLALHAPVSSSSNTSFSLSMMPLVEVSRFTRRSNHLTCSQGCTLTSRRAVQVGCSKAACMLLHPFPAATFLLRLTLPPQCCGEVGQRQQPTRQRMRCEFGPGMADARRLRETGTLRQIGGGRGSWAHANSCKCKPLLCMNSDPTRLPAHSPQSPMLKTWLPRENAL